MIRCLQWINQIFENKNAWVHFSQHFGHPPCASAFRLFEIDYALFNAALSVCTFIIIRYNKNCWARGGCGTRRDVYCYLLYWKGRKYWITPTAHSRMKVQFNHRSPSPRRIFYKYRANFPEPYPLYTNAREIFANEKAIIYAANQSPPPPRD